MYLALYCESFSETFIVWFIGSDMITQKEIAERAGVSRQLVSHALSGRSNVSGKTRSRIYAAAKELGYHPDANWSARLLLAKRYREKGKAGNDLRPEELVAPPIYLIRYERASQSDNANLIYLDFFQGLSEAFSAWKRGSALATLLSGQTDVDVVRNLVETGRASGIINMDLTPEATQYLIAKQFPMVVLNVNAPIPGVPCVVADHLSGYSHAWRAAARAGHRRIAFVGYHEGMIDGSNFGPRMKQCIAGADASGTGLGIESTVRVPEYDERDGVWKAFLEAYGPFDDGSRWPTLIFTVNDTCATSVITAMQAHGIRVPQQVSVIGFDDTVLSQYFSPTITTLSKPRFEMGKVAAQLLGDLLAGVEGSNDQSKVYPVKFIRRDSFAAAPAGLS